MTAGAGPPVLAAGLAGHACLSFVWVFWGSVVVSGVLVVAAVAALRWTPRSPAFRRGRNPVARRPIPRPPDGGRRGDRARRAIGVLGRGPTRTRGDGGAGGRPHGDRVEGDCGADPDGAGARADPGGADRPEPVAGPPARLDVDLVADTGPLTVVLSRVAHRSSVPAFDWLPPGGEPGGRTSVAVGVRGPWTLHVDLSCVPDALAVVGAPDDRRRFAAGLRRQLLRAGVGVTTVAGAVEDDPCRATAAADDWPFPDELPPGPQVVIGEGPPPPGVLRLPEVTAGRVVPIVLSGDAGTAWTVLLRARERGAGDAGDAAR